jgi:hypothetical protein
LFHVVHGSAVDDLDLSGFGEDVPDNLVVDSVLTSFDEDAPDVPDNLVIDSVLSSFDEDAPDELVVFFFDSLGTSESESECVRSIVVIVDIRNYVNLELKQSKVKYKEEE